MKRPEILSPAGNFEKMKSAILFGADAVYLAGQVFGMRAAADNFTIEELHEAVAYAHERGVKVYLTLNTMPREYEYPLLEEYVGKLAKVGLDAMIIADVGVMALVQRIIPDMEIHISTQANATSAAACLAWYKMGAKRVVLARELYNKIVTNEQKSIIDENGLYAKLTSAEKRISDLEFLQNEENQTPDTPNEGDDNVTEEPKEEPIPTGAVVAIVILAIVAVVAIGGCVVLMLPKIKSRFGKKKETPVENNESKAGEDNE